MPIDPNQLTGPTLRPFGGWLKRGEIAGIPVLYNTASINTQNQFRYTQYVYTPLTGFKQKTGHARGTTETSFNISGDFSLESVILLNFITPQFRGFLFPIDLQQGQDRDFLPFCMCESFSLSGNSNALIQYTMQGKSFSTVNVVNGAQPQVPHHPIPAWSSGNHFIKSWTVTHNTSLQANWANNQNPYPLYYRPGESEFQMQIQCASVLREYDTISVSLGVFAIISGVVTERSVTHGGRDLKTYSVSVTNVDLNQNAYTPGALLATGVVPDAWPDGI